MIQFQCQKEGSLFYYQHGRAQEARALVRCCPVCGSRRVRVTGRVYPAVDESASIVVEVGR